MLPIDTEQYRNLVEDCQASRTWLDEMIHKYPELFPANICAGYTFHDSRRSVKLAGVFLRRICLDTRDAAGKEQVFTIAPSGVMPYGVGKLCAKGDCFILAYDHPLAHRTSNMLDQHMNLMDRWLFSSRFFYGHWKSAERAIRAWALLHDFGPYCPRVRNKQAFSSPAHKLNGFVYHDNWLHNLSISTSMSGVSQ